MEGALKRELVRFASSRCLATLCMPSDGQKCNIQLFKHYLTPDARWTKFIAVPASRHPGQVPVSAPGPEIVPEDFSGEEEETTKSMPYPRACLCQTTIIDFPMDGLSGGSRKVLLTARL